MKKLILLGVKQNNIITGEFEITTRNGYKEFRATFNEGELFNIDDVNYREWFDEYWNCIGSEEKLYLLDDGKITKEEAYKNWKKSLYGYRDVCDCSCTDYEIEKNGNDYNFLTVCCGQHDIREENYKDIIFTNKEVVEKLLYMWDNYHLKKINEEIEKNIIDLLDTMTDYKEYEEKFYNFIKENIEE